MDVREPTVKYLAKPAFQQTEIGPIPTGWVVKSLGKVATLQRGFDLPHRMRQQGDVPIVTSSGTEATHSEAKVKSPGVVTGRYGTIGQVFYVERDFWPLNTTLYVRDFHGNDPLFVSYLLRTIDFDAHSGKSGVPGINRNDLHQELVPLPPSAAEQQAIATALSDADALIESLEQLLTKKRQIKQGAMQELLAGKRRLPGFTEEWKRKKLGDLLGIRHGKSQRDVESSDGEFPILATGGLIGKANKFLYDKPSVLIGRKGTIDQPQYMDTPFWTVDTLFYSEIFAQNSAKFLFYRFCLIDWKQYNEASGVPSLNARTIESVEVLCPDPQEQTAIAEVLSAMDADIVMLEAKLTKAHNVQQGMMQELLSGRVRLVQTNAEIISFPAPKKEVPENARPHNRQFEEAVMLAVFAKTFGSEQHPLARVRRTKLLYLLHRHVEGAAEGYLKKAAGPYNPKTRYKGAEGIVVKNGYVRAHHNGTYEGFVAGEKVAEAEAYFDKWYEPAVRTWLEQFHYAKTEALELLATVDMAMEDLRQTGKNIAVNTVKQVIQSHPEWQAKLEREIFSDANIERAIARCEELFGESQQ